MNDDKKAAERHVERGQWGFVRYAERADGTMEAKLWLEDQNDKTKAGFAVLFTRMADTGQIHNKELFRQLDGKIYEFKRRSNRIPTFRLANSWYLTHCFRKSGQKCPRKEIARAHAIRNEFLQVLEKENRDASK